MGLVAGHLLLDDRRDQRLEDGERAREAQPGVASGELADPRMVGPEGRRVVEQAGHRRAVLEGPARLPSPQARTRSAPSAIARWTVAGPSGVRVARQMPSAPMRIVGSPRPRQSGPSVRRRSSGTSSGTLRSRIDPVMAASLACRTTLGRERADGILGGWPA